MKNPTNLVSKDVLYRITLRLIPLLVICYIFAHLDRVNVGFAKETMSADLGFSHTAYGTGAGLFFISYMLFGVPANQMLDRFGARKWMATMMIVWGITSATMMLVTNVSEFYLLRFLLGVAEAGFFPGMLIYINRWFPPRARGKVTSIFTIAVPLASVIGAPISGWIIENFKTSSAMAGWRWMFLLEGAPIIALGILILFYLPDSFQTAKWISAPEKQALHNEIAAAESKKDAMSFQHFFRDIKLLQLFAIYFCVMLGINAINFWMPSIIHATGIESDSTVGLLTAIPWALAAGFMVLVGYSSDRNNERRWHLAVPLIMVALGFSGVGLLSGSTVVVVCLLAIATMGAATALPLFWQLPSAILTDKAAIAGIALVSSLGNLAGFVAPFLIGWIKDLTNSTSIALYLLSLVILLGTAVIFVFPAKTFTH